MKDKTTDLRNLATHWLNLLIGPTAISLLAIIVTNIATLQTNPLWLYLLTFVFIFFAGVLYLIGHTGLLKGSLSKISIRLRSRRFRRPRVLILSGLISDDPGESPPNPEHTDRTTTDWRAVMQAQGWDVEIGPTQIISGPDTPDVIINPFGEVYPEEDFVSNKTVNEIREYVWNGGVYVTVAGIPFWYRYNPRSGKRETAGRVEGIFEGQPAWLSLFYDMFPNLSPHGEAKIVDSYQTEEDKNRFGNIMDAGNDTTTGRFRAYPLRRAQLLPILRSQDETQCLIGAFLYGQGAFIFSGVFIQNGNNSFEKVVAAVKGWADFEVRQRQP